MAAKERVAKRAKLLDDASSESGDEGALNGQPETNGFGINEDYAKRFEHNKKREERHRLEEKYGKGTTNPLLKRSRDDEDDDEDDDSSEDESEDDDAEFATEDVDHEILATLNAIKSKDPSVYNKNVRFYKEFEASATGSKDDHKNKPMYLQDYHRQNLLAGDNGEQFEDEPPRQTYQDEQDQLRRELVGSMHATAPGDGNDAVNGDDEDFLVAKERPKHEGSANATSGPKITDRDVKQAEADPETYLSNFMAARAWLPQAGSRWEAFESDDSEDEERADEFEEAYNMRFEDPSKANEKLLSFARDVGKYSVRRDEKSTRKRAREREQEKKDAERRERDEERARLRKLKIEEAEEKLQKIKEAAGMSGKTVRLEDWRDVLEGDFDDDEWEEAMKRRFGDQYYAEGDGDEMPDDEITSVEHRKKIKKPKWADDIDIDDIVPDFEAEDSKPAFTLSSDEESGGDEGGVRVEDSDSGDPVDGSDDGADKSRKRPKTKKDRAKEKSEAKRAARIERRQLEEMVDSSLPLAHPALASSTVERKASVAGFRYRETSPGSFGLSARDILFANDAQLNEYAGLKKLASFRDEEKKRRDKKKLSKKARLKQWRKDTFGNPDAPTGGFERLLGRQSRLGQTVPLTTTHGKEGGIVEGERKRKRSRKGKKAAPAMIR